MKTEVIDSLIQGLQYDQPRLYDALRAISLKLKMLDKEQQLVRSFVEAGGVTGSIEPIVSFIYYFTPRNVVLGWTFPSGVRQAEVRKGASWETGDVQFVSSSTTALIEPLPTGTTRFWIKGLNYANQYSTSATSLDVVVPQIGNVLITADVIDNNVLLKWAEPSSTFEISYYEIKKGSEVVGIVDGTFITVFEVTGGTYQYKIAAYDIAGNVSPEATISADVKQPPDYSLTASLLDPNLDGTKTNVVLINGKLQCNLTNETWAQHFSNNSWLTPQDQIDADYPYYAEPTPLTGAYEKEFDAGTEYANVIINTFWNQNQIFGSTSVGVEICFAPASHTFNAYVAGRSRFASLVRYVKVKFTFTGTNDKALLEFSNFYTNMDVKREVDSGSVNAVSTDVGGTSVTFNKAFKDVDSITLGAESVDPIYIVYDFVDVPNPTGFKVLVFNSSGVRIDKTISWKARGVV